MPSDVNCYSPPAATESLRKVHFTPNISRAFLNATSKSDSFYYLFFTQNKNGGGGEKPILTALSKRSRICSLLFTFTASNVSQ